MPDGIPWRLFILIVAILLLSCVVLMVLTGAHFSVASAASLPTATRHPTATWGTPVPTATARPPVLDLFGEPMVESLRITSGEIWHVGSGSVQGVMQTESDPMVMARVAMAESPGNFNDRMFVMWLIRLRSELGFKNAGDNAGTRAKPDRWGPPTTIKREALCDGGCQFEVVRATVGIYWPEGIKSPGIRAMVSPDDEQLADLWLTYQAAVFILSTPLSYFPADLRGYDSFRSPSVDWYGKRYYEGGLRSRQLFPRGLIWRDESPQDNVFWLRESSGH